MEFIILNILKNKKPKYIQSEDLKEKLLNEELKIECIYCKDIFYPIKTKDPEVNCPNCGTKNNIK